MDRMDKSGSGPKWTEVDQRDRNRLKWSKWMKWIVLDQIKLKFSKWSK